ncbi:MAG: LacI family transcriptional regulator [Treponema sp.]|jgi:LacI family transcriptional regulator|nr:LacI family transcriptional regulator [Treponema sp.]
MNIYDIANEAGVSIATVSRVLNNRSSVNRATRDKIRAILDKYNYTPSAIARGLVAHSMKTVAIFTVDLRASHYAWTTYTIEREFSRRGYHVIVCNTGGKLEETREYARSLVSNRQIDGVVLAGPVFDEVGRDPGLSATFGNLPVVVANGQLDLPNSYSVLVDDAFGVFLAAEHLVKRGRQDMVYLKDLDTAGAEIKHDGFVKAMDKLGRKYTRDMTLATAYGLEGGRQAAERILQRASRPSAVVCGEDLTAVGLIKGLAGAGLRIPDDIAVTGYNNSEYSLICSPELTTVDNKGEMSARSCVQLLEARINNDSSFSSLRINPELVIRQSS